MSWEQKQTDAELAEYNAILTTSDAYGGATVKGLKNIRDTRAGEFWIYQRAGMTLLLATSVGELNGSPAVKIVNAVPSGTWSPVPAMKIVIRKVREIVDRLGIPWFYASSLEDYGDDALNEFHRSTPQLLWETTRGVMVRGKFRVAFRRANRGQHDDESFAGPGRTGR